MPYNVIRVQCNTEPADDLEVGHVIDRDVAPDQQVYIRVASDEAACEINLSREEVCALAHRILYEFETTPPSINPYR